MKGRLYFFMAFVAAGVYAWLVELARHYWPGISRWYTVAVFCLAFLFSLMGLSLAAVGDDGNKE